MANVKITELPQVSSLLGTDILPTVASSATSKITVADLANSLPQVSSSISASYAINSISSSYPIAVTGSTLYSVAPRAGTDFNTNNNIFLGEGSGQDSTSDNSNFIGNQSGYQAINSYRSNFIGQTAGYQASNSDDSNFLGYKAGYQAINSYNSNFLGFNAGDQASGSNNSNFIGSSAGQNAEDAEASNFIGYNVGQNAATVQNSNFIGVNVGRQARSASYSTLIGFSVGDNLDTNNEGIGSNNIIIGKWITLENKRKDSINLGGIIFGTGSYSDTPIDYLPFSGSANGKIGINQPLPQFNLDVSGSGRYTNGLIVTGSVQITNVLTLPAQNPLPAGIATGSIAVSGSGVDCKPYFWNGSTWTSMI